MTNRTRILLERIIRKIIQEKLSNNDFKPGDKIIFSIPYSGSKMEFNGKVIQSRQNLPAGYVSIEYKTGGKKLITDAPVDWITKK